MTYIQLQYSYAVKSLMYKVLETIQVPKVNKNTEETDSNTKKGITDVFAPSCTIVNFQIHPTSRQRLPSHFPPSPPPTFLPGPHLSHLPLPSPPSGNLLRPSSHPFSFRSPLPTDTCAALPRYLPAKSCFCLPRVPVPLETQPALGTCARWPCHGTTNGAKRGPP